MLALPTTACRILQTLMGNIVSGYPRALITAGDHKRAVNSYYNCFWHSTGLNGKELIVKATLEGILCYMS